MNRAYASLGARKTKKALCLFYALESVSDPRFGFDQVRLGWIGLDLLPKMSDINA